MTTPHSTSQPITLYGFKLSGHCHRVELLLNLIELPYRYIDVNLRGGEHKKPEFLAMNSFGQVPVIDDHGFKLADSNAILIYLASRYAPQWYPPDGLQQAQLQKWFSVAAGSLAYGPAMARRIKIFGSKEDAADAIDRANSLFNVMNAELNYQPFLVGAQPTLADIAMYAYTARAPEGDVSLDPFPNVQAWLARVEALPRFVPMSHAQPRQ